MKENFIKSALSKAKTFLKDKYTSLKKNSKKFFKELKNEFMAPKSKEKFQAGNLIAMNYNAKDQKKKYDRTPLIICLGWSKEFPNTHLYGLNLHWLPLKDRVYVASFFVELLKKRKKLTYKDVKPFMYKFKDSPVLRMYIYNNISGKVIVMPSDVYLSAAALPSEQWMGG